MHPEVETLHITGQATWSWVPMGAASLPAT
jgi:hypothetical protein